MSFLQKMALAMVVSLAASNSNAQTNLIYNRLPVGKHAVGFKIITFTDESRMSRPEFNYLGGKNEGDRLVKISVHIWYPAKANTGSRKMNYADHCFNYLLKTTNETLDTWVRDGELNNRRRTVENWFGATKGEPWKKLVSTPLLASADAEPLTEKFPLLIGALRSLSTTVTNEMLASNGYVVAMVQADNPVPQRIFEVENIADMRFVMSRLQQKFPVDADKIGTFGFSGSGFSQVLMAMNDYRIKAVADIESGLYMDNLFQQLSASNYYLPARLRAPFLHIFSRDLSKQEVFIDEFTSKTKFAKRYRLLLNQPALHHWDFATEGYTAAIFLENRGDKAENIRRSFEIHSLYLLRFFDAELKKEKEAMAFLEKPAFKNMPDSLWSLETFHAGKPAPNRDEFEYIVRNKGIDEAVSIVRNTIKNDSSTNLLQWFNLNRLGYNFLGEKKYKEAIGMFRLNTELHPDDPNLFDSLSEGLEVSGDKESMKKAAANVMSLLEKKNTLTDLDKTLKTNAERRLK